MKAGLWLLPLLLLGGCNWIGNVTGLNSDANRAIGAACRQTGRSLEECFMRNPDADQAHIYAGWREMNEYMVKNKLDTMLPPTDPKAVVAAPPKPAAKTVPPTVQMAPPVSAVPPALSNEEAERQVQNDPEVNAVLSAIRERNGKSSAVENEADQHRLLKIIKQIEAKPAAPS